jgi:hypothetical protein
MASQQQIQANRRNCRLSTGPRTPQGKAAVCQNARRYGFTSRDAVLPGESQDEFLALLNACRSDHQPQSPAQDDLVRQIAAANWRIRRLQRIGASLSEEQFLHVFDQFLRHENRFRRARRQAILALIAAQDEA